MVRRCKKHGIVEYIRESTGFHRCSKCRKERSQQVRHGRKAKLVKLFGGKCEVCGYARTNRALQFHHIDPKTKKFSITPMLQLVGFDTLLAEANKCLLLCANCHAEVEDGLVGVEKLAKARRDSPVEIAEEVRTPPVCASCGGPINNPNKRVRYCSKNCRGMLKRKVIRPVKDVLVDDLRTMTWRAVGKKYGVSDNAVRKWAKSYGIM